MRREGNDAHLWIQFVDQLGSLFDIPSLNSSPDLHPALDAGQVDLRRNAGLARKVFGRVAEAFDVEVVGDDGVQVSARCEKGTKEELASETERRGWKRRTGVGELEISQLLCLLSSYDLIGA